MFEVIAGMHRLQQAVKTLMGIVAGQQPGGSQPRAKASPHTQRQAPPFLGIEVSVQEFLNLKPPTFSGNLVTEELQLLIDKVGKAIKTSRCSTTRAIELVANQLDLAEQWYENMLQVRLATSPPIN